MNSMWEMPGFGAIEVIVDGERVMHRRVGSVRDTVHTACRSGPEPWRHLSAATAYRNQAAPCQQPQCFPGYE